MRALARSASVIAFSAIFVSATNAYAQDAAPNASDEATPEIVVSGVRASLERSMDLKRNSTGVVDGISAEDIGKFPDTNVAESLQRVAGVSIDRVNGEGSRVTVRGFGPGYNLVTLNGRTLPTASIASIGQDQNGDFVSGTTRSFDFSNIASEGVSRLEVYKTARASVPGGGIGATINIVTRRPLDYETGLTGSIGAKAVYDASDTYDFDRVTPEVSGVLNYASPDDTWGVGLFASYQKRNNSAASVTVNDWNIETFGAFSDSTRGRVTSNATIENAPSPETLVAFPNDTRYDYSEFSRERINGQLTLQFRPSDALEVTGDVTFYQNDAEEHRTDQANWYNRPFEHVIFDDNPNVATTIFLDDTLTTPKDNGFEDQFRATRERLWSYGLNLGWNATDRLKLTLDGHLSKAEALPNNPLGHTSTLFSLAQKGVADQTLTIVNGFPQEGLTFDDSTNGNNNGILDLADLGSQVVRSQTAKQSQTVHELRFDGAWDVGDDDRVNFGASYRDSNMTSRTTSTQNALGDWGVNNIGDIQANAADLVQEFCLTCKFTDFDTGATGQLLTAFRADATKLWNAFSFTPTVNGTSHNLVHEKIWAAYAEVDANFELLNRPANIVAGVRYEHTNSHSTSFQGIPQSIDWTQNNDFLQVLSADEQPVEGKNSYDHILPALDFSVDLTDTLKGRVSYGKSISRPDFGSLFASTNPGSPNRPVYLGGVPGGNAGNPQLVPLVSDNFDASLEWYFARSSYISAGFFDKRVRNFVGTGQTTTELFGLRDPSSGAAGTRSGAAVEYLQDHGFDVTEDNYFVMTALIDQMGGNVAAAGAEFQSHIGPSGALPQSYIDSINIAYDVVANADDPPYEFQIQQPVNNREGHIYGAEIQGQYFLGNTGFGVAAAYTLVRGDIGFDILAATTSDQFALLGLSDTFNASLIFEKFGISARVTYNWRDKYLSNNSRGSSRNPVFVAPYDQWDVNVSYDITPNIQVSFEGINLTGSNVRTYARTRNEPWFIVDGRPRYYAGVRFKF
jgi:TonB-dependent receptor